MGGQSSLPEVRQTSLRAFCSYLFSTCFGKSQKGYRYNPYRIKRVRTYNESRNKNMLQTLIG
jgi:hypothetical protein